MGVHAQLVTNASFFRAEYRTRGAQTLMLKVARCGIRGGTCPVGNVSPRGSNNAGLHRSQPRSLKDSKRSASARNVHRFHRLQRPMHCLWEIIDNSVDEALAGTAQL